MCAMRNNEEKNNHLLVLFFTAYTITAFFKISANIVIPIFQNRFAISSSFAGLISGMYYLPYAFQQLFAAPLSHKYGASRVVATGFVIAAGGSILFAFASNAYMVMAGRFLVGVGVGPVFISIIQYLTEHFKGREFALYTGLAVTFSGLGQAIASAPLKILIEKFGITSVFLSLSVLMFFVSAILFAAGKTNKQNSSREYSNVFKQIGTTAKAVVKSPLLTLITMSWIFYNSIQHSYQGLWSAKWMTYAFPSQSALSGMSATLVSIGLMCGTFFSERLKPKAMTRLNCTVRSEYFFALSAMMISFTHLISVPLILIFDFILGFAVGDICIQQTSFVREVSEDTISSSITGFMNFCSSLGTLFFQWITGLSVDILLTKEVTPKNAYLITFLGFASANLIITFFCTHEQRKLSV